MWSLLCTTWTTEKQPYCSSLFVWIWKATQQNNRASPWDLQASNTIPQLQRLVGDVVVLPLYTSVSHPHASGFEVAAAQTRPPLVCGEEAGCVFHLWVMVTAEAVVMVRPWWAEGEASFRTIQSELTIEVGRNHIRNTGATQDALWLWTYKGYYC